MPKPGHNKYKVSAKADRTYAGKVYASKAEMFFARMLAMMLANGEVLSVVEQPRVTLLDAPRHKDRIVYVPDFLVTYKGGEVMYIDVKGMQTPEFKLKLKLWIDHGPGKLRLVKQSGKPNKFTGLPKFKDAGTFGPGGGK